MSPRPGYSAVTPYLICREPEAAIDWYAKHLGARERYRLTMPDGAIAHCELEIGDAVIMLAGEFADMGIVSPSTLGGSPVSLNAYVDDADATFAAMVADGAEELFAVKDQFHGDRSGKLRDPFGHVWHIATNTENLEPAEIERRFATMMQGDG